MKTISIKARTNFKKDGKTAFFAQKWPKNA